MKRETLEGMSDEKRVKKGKGSRMNDELLLSLFCFSVTTIARGAASSRPTSAQVGNVKNGGEYSITSISPQPNEATIPAMQPAMSTRAGAVAR